MNRGSSSWGLALLSIALSGACGLSSQVQASAIPAPPARESSTVPLSVEITQPAYGFNVLPGSVRRIFATVTGGTTNALTWAATGGAQLSATTGPWVDVTAPSTGSKCSIKGSESFSVSSATQFTLTAKSQENPEGVASITVNVCNPAVDVHVIPFYTTLYSGQKADIQAFVWGSVDRNVTWAITASPAGGDAVLSDSVNEDTVFSATVAGRYTLTATSAANGARSNTATVFVTGHPMPYPVTPAKTMPVDCRVDPELKGKTYEVGPSQAFKTIQSVPWTSLKDGSTVRIHNEDTSGASPTTYHEYFQLAMHASRNQPIRVCGVPDAQGHLPVLDASNSSGRSDVSGYSAGYAAVGMGATGWAGLYSADWGGPQYLIVEGLKIENASSANSYATPTGGQHKDWEGGSACVRLFRSMETVVRGLDVTGCGNGFMSDFNANNGYAAVGDTLYEGNHLHGNGEAKSFLDHQLYIQGWDEVVQFNLIDEYVASAAGSNLKARGFPEIVRYNHFGDGASRQIDMVDNQDAAGYSTFEGYLGGGKSSYRGVYPADTYTADLLAAAVEAHHGDAVYGNTFVNSSAGVPIHYSTDHGSLENDRLGTLWFYNNSFYEPVCKGCPNWRWYMFDTSGGGGNSFPEIEWPQIQVDNNAIWMDSPSKPVFFWNNRLTQFTIFGKNAINADWGSGKMAGGDGTGWAGEDTRDIFQGAGNMADTTGVSNLMRVFSAPFNRTTYVPAPALMDAGSAMPVGAPKLPVRFQFGPSATPVVRKHPRTIGAMD